MKVNGEEKARLGNLFANRKSNHVPENAFDLSISTFVLINDSNIRKKGSLFKNGLSYNFHDKKYFLQH